MKIGIIHLQPGENHILTNCHDKTDLIFTSTWWANANGACFSDKEEGEEVEKNRVILISPPATPNGDLHLGHIAGPYLGADILKRSIEQKGRKVFHLTGSDDNQSYVQLKASQTGTTPEHIANSFAVEIESTLRDFNIIPDSFYRPLSNENYTQFVQDFFLHLYQGGILEEQLVKEPYCSHCNLWLFEANIKGACPVCQQFCGGNICENCGNPNNCSDLVEPFCKHCQQSPIQRETTHLIFPLQKYVYQLQTFWQKSQFPARIRVLLRELVTKNLPDVRVTRHSDWGITAPFPSFENYKICSWCEMVPGYLWEVSELNGSKPLEQIEAWNEDDTEIILFFGFDNTFFLYNAFSRFVDSISTCYQITFLFHLQRILSV